MIQTNLYEDIAERRLRPLRWYQEPAIPMFRDSVRHGNKKIVGQAPCGFGKTILAAHLIDSSMKKGNRVLFTCPRISLVDQTLKSFELQGIKDIGVMQADHPRTNPMCKLQIACLDTLYSRTDYDMNFGFVIIDEAHLVDDRLYKLFSNWDVVLGLTATPWKKGLGLHYSDLIVLSTIKDMIAHHEKDPSVGLVPVRGKGPNWDLLMGIDKLKKGDDGEFREKGASLFMDRKEVIADVVETWLKTRQEGDHPGNRTFLFTPTRINAKNLQEAFFAQGINFGYIDAFTSNRLPIFEAFRERRIEGIASVGCLTTGVDEDVRCIIDAALSNNESTIVQKIGRGLRPAEGKDYLYLLDHTGNANRFGWFADIFHDKLDTTPPHVKGSAYEQDEAAPKNAKAKQCNVCRTILPRGAFKCPACGNPVVFDDIVTIKGDLIDLEKNKKTAKKRKREYSTAEKEEWYNGLLWLVRERGKSDGLAWHRFNDKFGHFPSGYAKTPVPPSFEVEQWEKSQRIRWAKSQNKNKAAVA